MKCSIRAVLFVLAMSQVLSAQERLEPVEGYFDSYGFLHHYHSKIRNTLLLGLDSDAIATFVSLHSFVPESAVVIRKVGKEYRIAMVYMKPMLWIAREDEPVEVIRQESPIGAELGEIARDLFFEAASQAAYPTEATVGLDGVTYYFVGVRDGFGPRGGQAYTPTDGSFTDQLAKFGLELGVVLAAKDAALREKKELELLKVGKTLLSKIRDARHEGLVTP